MYVCNAVTGRDAYMEAKELLELFRHDLAEFVRNAEDNYVSGKMALCPEDLGQRLYDDPIISVGSADDPLWDKMKEPGVVGPCFRTPAEWMPGARTVISYFAPFSDYVIDGNKVDPVDVGHGWLYARVDGQKFLTRVNHFIEFWFSEHGVKAFSPYASTEFDYIFEPGTNPKFDGNAFTSNWSERHVAFICGLGTFGLSKALITEKGVCGRFGSVITDIDFPVDERPYNEVYEYCINCGACCRCPADAISLQEGKSLMKCTKYFDILREKYAPRFGCGKCYVHTPCERGIPSKTKEK